MEDQITTRLTRTPEVIELLAGDPCFERLQEINNLIATRAYQLFESRGCICGHEVEDWVRAESETLQPIRLDVIETDTELIVRADVPGFTERDLEIRVAPRCLFITGGRTETTGTKRGRTVYSERQARQLFRMLDLPVKVDTETVLATLSDGLLEITLAKAETAKKVPILAKAAGA